jgi:GT2 family glycosyltransferase
MERVSVHEGAPGGPAAASTPGAEAPTRGMRRALRALRLFPAAVQITRRWLRRRGVSRGLAEMRSAMRVGGLLGLRRMWLDHGEPVRYRDWLRAQRSARGDGTSEAAVRLRQLSAGPRFVIVLDGRGAVAGVARASRASVARQAWPATGVVCLTDAASEAWWDRPDVVLALPRHWHDIRRAIASLDAEFVVFLRAGELLHAEATLRAAEALTEAPGAALVYADHDRIDRLGGRFDPWFKAGWDPDLLLSQDYLGPMTALAARRLPESLDSEDTGPLLLPWAVKLHGTHKLCAPEVVHLREVLAHETENVGPPGAEDPAALLLRFLRSAASRTDVQRVGPGRWRVRPPLPQPPPKVSVIVPTRDRADLLERCAETLLGRTRYPDFELLVVDNRSTETAAQALLRSLEARSSVRVLAYDQPFNFAAINNWAVRRAVGSVVCLLNNDTEVISPEWLEEMVAHALREEVGAVGAMLYYPDETIQHAGVQLGLAGFLGHRCLRRPRGFAGPRESLLHVQAMPVVTAACLVIRKSVYEEVGGMDERAFPIAYNDVDFCLRILERGYRNLWTPYAELYHHESATRGSDLDPVRAARLDAEREALRARWGARLRGDATDYGQLV